MVNSFNYTEYKLHGLTVDDSIRRLDMCERLISELYLDVLNKCRIFVNMDSCSNSNAVMELKSDEDVQWFLHMCHDVKDASFPLIVHDVCPWEINLPVADCIIQEENFVVDDSAPSVAVYQDMVMGNSPGNYEVGLNQVFGCKEYVQKALTVLAFKMKFQFKVDRSCKNYFNVSCVNSNCNWKACSSKVSNASSFILRKYVPDHTCSLDSVQSGHRQASTNMIALCVKDRVISNTGKIWTARDIIDYFQKEYYFTIPYQTAWRSLNHALDFIRGNSYESYTLLPLFAEELCLRNPGSFTNYLVDGDGHFKYFFMAVSASIQGWPHCRPMMSVDATFLTGHFKSTMIIACTLDINRHIFLLAMAIVDFENDAVYCWFFENIRRCFGNREDIVIVSDRHKSIEKGVAYALPQAFHGICVYHLEQNLRTRFHNNVVSDLFKASARAYTRSEFNFHMGNLEKISATARHYLEEVGVHKWARCFAKYSRYQLMTSNISESLNNVFKEVKNQPVVAIAESFSAKAQKWFYERNLEAQSTMTNLGVVPEGVLRPLFQFAGSLTVNPINESCFMIIDKGKHFTVDLEMRTCDCQVWQYDDIPCLHSCAAIRSQNLSPYAYVSKYYTREELRASYMGVVYPVGTKEQWATPVCMEEDKVKPPKQKRPAGRPKTVRFKPISELKKKNSYRCGRCGKIGHNRVHCKNPFDVAESSKRTT